MNLYLDTKISDNMEMTPEGYLLCKKVPCTGVVEMQYSAKEIPEVPAVDGMVTVVRDKRTFNPEFLASFNGKPFTKEHPQTNVTPENWKFYAVGMITNAYHDDKNIYADILVTDESTIKTISRGVREVSVGYKADLELIAPGKCVQIPVLANHVALVNKGRAGREYAIKDHAISEDLMADEEKITVPTGFFSKLLGRTLEDASTEENKSRIDSLAKRFDALDAAHKTIIAKEDEIMSMIKAIGDRQTGKRDTKDAALDNIAINDAAPETFDTVLYGAVNAFCPGYPKNDSVADGVRCALKMALAEDGIGTSVNKLLDGENPFSCAFSKARNALEIAYELKKQKNNASQMRFGDSAALNAAFGTTTTMTPEEMNKKHQEYWAKRGI